VVTLFAMKEAGLKYHLFAQSLNELLPPDLTKQEKVQQLAQQFANVVEKMVKKYPEQWFNFYELFNRHGY
jgi:predicted LPLAT superfamily acyltransferase